MTLPIPVDGLEPPASGPILDRFGRAHTYLRLSVTDRCNFRCTYCLPAEGVSWMDRSNLLSFEEITRIVAVLAANGVHRIRLTGGEPTIRKGLVHLVKMIASCEGVDDLSMTTNGHLFGPHAQTFANAGLRRVNVSLDTLEPDAFKRITRGGDLARVLDAIDRSVAAGLTPVKINAVMVSGENDDQLLPMASHFLRYGSAVQLRFIEHMPFGSKLRRHIPEATLRENLGEHYTVEAVPRAIGGGPAVMYRLGDSGFTVGFISAMTGHFCETCNRLRLMADGHLRTCLSRDPTESLRDLIRKGMDDRELEAELRGRVWGKVAGHEAHLVDEDNHFEGVMTQIGG